MRNKKTKWLIYTVLVGLIPILARFMVWFVTKEGSLDLLSASDFVAFGLVLHISNINEIEHYEGQREQWKTVQNGISITFIAFYSILLALNLVGADVIDIKAITFCAIGLSVVSFVISYSVYDAVSRILITSVENKI